MIQAARDADPTAPAASETRGFRRLGALGRVGLHDAACVATRGLADACRRCIDACPHGGLARHDGRLELDPVACTGCGLCAASCPTGALAADGFALPTTIPARGIAVVCERTRAPSGIALHRVPCVRGLACADWLRLALIADATPVYVVDAAVCAGCPNAAVAGVMQFPALEAARRALADAGVAPAGLPQPGLPRSLPFGNDAQHAVGGRRGFLAGLSRSVVSAVAAGAAPSARNDAPAVAPRVAVGEHRGTEMRLLLLQIARRHGRGQPAHAELPALSASAACRAHGVCTRVCPTGALALDTADAARATLLFDAWRCSACGACADFCPERALSLEPPAWRAFASAKVALAVVERCECRRCGAPFSADDDETLCDRCRKSEALARAGFALFRRPRQTPAAPEGP